MSIDLNGVEIAKLPMVFILAKGRSGTTLLQTIIDAHPNSVAPLESRFVLHFYNKYGKKKNWSTSLKEQFADDILKEQKIELFWNLDREKLIYAFNTLGTEASYADHCKAVYVCYNSFFNKGVPSVIVDKNPIHGLTYPIIRKVFPDAKFIHVVRDYRAVVLSTRVLQPFKGNNELANRWLLSNIETEKLKNLIGSSIFQMRYEDLIAKPNETMKEVCSFLDLNFNSELLKYHEVVKDKSINFITGNDNEHNKRLRQIGAEKIHKNLSRPIDPNIAERWKTELHLNEKKEIELICGKLGSQYGYEKVTDVIPGRPKLTLKMKWFRDKLRLYYSLPIWLRELKSKPTMAFVENEKK